MAQSSSSKANKAKAPARSQKTAPASPANVLPSQPGDRVFGTRPDIINLPSFGLSAAGAFGLGASMFGLWVMEPATAWSSIGVLLSLISIGAGMFLAPLRETEIRVGEAGVTISDGAQSESIAWEDLKEIVVGKVEVKLLGKQTLSFNLRANLPACAYLLKMARERAVQGAQLEAEQGKLLSSWEEGHGLTLRA